MKFVFTDEMQEALEDVQSIIKLVKNPESLIEGLLLLFSFISIYFIFAIIL